MTLRLASPGTAKGATAAASAPQPLAALSRNEAVVIQNLAARHGCDPGGFHSPFVARH